MDLQLAGKRALVTGGSRGIGRAIAHALLDEGARVVIAAPGLVSFTGTSPADENSLSRNNVAAYVDLSTSIIKGWYVGAAGRFEHYDDSAGNTFSGKISTRVELAPGLAIRGGINNGFRAPSLAQSGFSTTQNTVTIIGQERVSTTSKFLPVDSAAAIALGATPLKPEKSLSFTGASPTNTTASA